MNHHIFVPSGASDHIFKIVIFHDVPPQGPQVYTQGFPELFGGWGGGGGRFCGVDLTPPRRLYIS